jgi:hypothetical protein
MVKKNQNTLEKLNFMLENVPFWNQKMFQFYMGKCFNFTKKWQLYTRPFSKARIKLCLIITVRSKVVKLVGDGWMNWSGQTITTMMDYSDVRIPDWSGQTITTMMDYSDVRIPDWSGIQIFYFSWSQAS